MLSDLPVDAAIPASDFERGKKSSMPSNFTPD
jgi:hypothetical protein